MKLTWIDRLLIKVALAKAAARGALEPHLAERLIEAFEGRNRISGPLTSDCACARDAMVGPGSTDSSAPSLSGGMTGAPTAGCSNKIGDFGPITRQEKDSFPLP